MYREVQITKSLFKRLDPSNTGIRRADFWRDGIDHSWHVLERAKKQQHDFTRKAHTHLTPLIRIRIVIVLLLSILAGAFSPLHITDLTITKQ